MYALSYVTMSTSNRGIFFLVYINLCLGKQDQIFSERFHLDFTSCDKGFWVITWDIDYRWVTGKLWEIIEFSIPPIEFLKSLGLKRKITSFTTTFHASGFYNWHIPFSSFLSIYNSFFMPLGRCWECGDGSPGIYSYIIIIIYPHSPVLFLY